MAELSRHLGRGGCGGVFRSVSPAWTRVLGHDVLEVVGHSFRDFVFQDEAEQTWQAIMSAAVGVDVRGFENRYRHKDGTPRLLDLAPEKRLPRLICYNRFWRFQDVGKSSGSIHA
jgi:PAS domain-containing protein